MAETTLIEAESFKDRGGWEVDTQFIHSMGSPYLLAHGLGQPVKDATTTITLPKVGAYKVFVRTKDWVARWKAAGAPGKFQLLVNGKALPETFGTQNAEWFWQPGGSVEITDTKVNLALHDLTGFDGRCDAILFTTDQAFAPPNDNAPMAAWRRQLLGLPEQPVDGGSYDLVVIGGGYGGLGAAIAAARMGCKVALIQERPVLGGNGSSEVRVWAMGGIRMQPYPHVGDIIEEISDKAKKSPGTAEEFCDDKKEAVVKAEKNLALFLNTHAYAVEKGGTRIKAVLGLNTMTSEVKRFTGALFADCTGHASIGALAGAELTIKEDGHMGMSNMWRWTQTDTPQTFPEVPWALDMDMADFPYPNRNGEWFWETGFNKHPINDLEYMRDWNLRAVFGAFNAMKNKGGKEKHVNAKIEWVAYVGGTRESRQLLGDVVLTRDDMVNKQSFPDACVPTTWGIDLHYPKEQYAKKFPEDPFISRAEFGKGIDKKVGYPVPYRCFYSKNIENLFMAGRNISVTHEALGTVRVMKTGGMMGEVVGKAASLCTKHKCTPRAVYTSHFDELKDLLKLPGKARRVTVNDTPDLPPDSVVPASIPAGTEAGATKLPGIVIDDRQAKFEGDWHEGESLSGYVGDRYLYHGKSGKGSARFEFKVPKTGKYEVRVAHQPHENRATNTPVTVVSRDGSKTQKVNQRVKAPLPGGFVSLGVFTFDAEKTGAVIISNEGVDGNVHADAVQVLPAE
ncbi:MAG TPA: FAD-dependent oxidoreductase [Planctomycetota bacterium]|jgi:hypothetical protein